VLLVTSLVILNMQLLEVAIQCSSSRSCFCVTTDVKSVQIRLSGKSASTLQLDLDEKMWVSIREVFGSNLGRDNSYPA
jgi:hypothetical protein